MSKKLSLLFIVFSVYFSVNAQQWSGSSATTGNISRTGFVGLGVTSPVTQLHLYNNSTALSSNNFITIENRGNNASYSTNHVIGGILFAGYSSSRTPGNLAGIWAERFPNIDNNNSSYGQLVFGVTNNPQNITADNQLPTDIMRLSFYNGLWMNSNLTNTDLNRPGVGDNLTSEIRGRSKSASWFDDGFLRLSAGGGTNDATKSFIDLSGSTTSSLSDRYQNITFGTSGVERMRITFDGNIGINTSDTKGYKLAVNGSVIFTEAYIKTYNNWPDYVFEPTYKLRSLQSLEAYIKANKHLPDVPSLEKIREDGFSIGENQALLLKKIEELTLYLIEQDKKIAFLQKEISNQHGKLRLLEANNYKK